MNQAENKSHRSRRRTSWGSVLLSSIQ